MASGFVVATNEHLIREKVYSRQLKDLLLDELMGMKYVNIITDFPDGTQWVKPTVGEAESADYVEGAAIQYNKMDTGEFTFTWDQYKFSANSITEQFKQDSFWASEVESMFVPKQHRALMVAVEARIFERANAGQTASNLNLINGAAHRFVGSGTNEVLELKDFALAAYALDQANVPAQGRVAIVDPSVVFRLQTLANLTNLLTTFPTWQKVVHDNATSGMRFAGFSIYGFDVYVSHYLPRNISETINARTVTVGVANQFFSTAGADIKPIIGGFKQMPTVYSEFNKDLQQTECLTIARYGFKLYRPENMVIILTDTDQVA
jgi:hypothetical protein